MLADRGAAIVGIDVLPLTETKALVHRAGARWLGITHDLSSPDGLSELGNDIENAFGRCDILVNNAAIFPTIPFDEMTYAAWRKVMAINLDTPFLLCQLVVPLMRRYKWGRIVNVVSSSVENSRSAMSAYKASKAGLVGLTRGLAPDVGDDGICVNAISPAFSRTAGNLKRGPEIVRRLSEMAQTQCIKRVAEPEDVVPTILFLTSDDASFVTGQTLYADGGMHFR
jgi:3-oxoacyl-[acyl-carrier protein] reductase